MQKILRTSALLAGVMLLYKMLGFLEKIVIAQRFGISATADAYLTGSAVVLLFGMLLNDIAGPTLIPYFLRLPERARPTLAALNTWTVLLTLIMVFFARQWSMGLARVFGPGFDLATQTMAATIIRTGMLALPMLCLAALWTAWYHAHERFTRPALADLCLKLGPLLGLLISGSLSGLMIGLVIGVTVRALVLLNRDLLVRPTLHTAELQPVLQAGWPLLLTSLVSIHLLGVIETAIASTIGTGAVAALAYARRIVDVPMMLAPNIIARAIFPELTLLTQARDYARLAVLLYQCKRWTYLVLAPLAVIGMVLTRPIVQLLLGRGAFDAEAVAPTAAVMLTMLPGLPALALSVLLIRFNYAAGDTRTPSIIRVIGAALQIGLALIGRRWGLMGLGWSVTAALWIETGGLLWAAHRTITVDPRLSFHFWSVLLSSCSVAAGFTWSLQQLWPAPTTTLGLLIYVSLLAMLGLGVYVIGVTLGRLVSLQMMWRRSVDGV